MTITPVGDRVLVKLEEAAKKTSSGLIIPETAQEKTQTGTVVAIGDDKDIKVKPNQKIMFEKYAGNSIKIDDKEHLILEMKNIIAIIS